MSQKTQKNKIKNKIHPFSPTTPSHITKKIIPWNYFLIPPSCFEKQPNFSFPCHPRNKPLG
jgi:hypothetical protein